MVVILLAFTLLSVVFAAIPAALAMFFARRWPNLSRGKCAAFAALSLPIVWLIWVALQMRAALKGRDVAGFEALASVWNVAAAMFAVIVLWWAGFITTWLTLRLAGLPKVPTNVAEVFE